MGKGGNLRGGMMGRGVAATQTSVFELCTGTRGNSSESSSAPTRRVLAWTSVVLVVDVALSVAARRLSSSLKPALTLEQALRVHTAIRMLAADDARPIRTVLPVFDVEPDGADALTIATSAGLEMRITARTCAYDDECGERRDLAFALVEGGPLLRRQLLVAKCWMR